MDDQERKSDHQLLMEFLCAEQHRLTDDRERMRKTRIQVEANLSLIKSMIGNLEHEILRLEANGTKRVEINDIFPEQKGQDKIMPVST